MQPCSKLGGSGNTLSVLLMVVSKHRLRDKPAVTYAEDGADADEIEDLGASTALSSSDASGTPRKKKLSMKRKKQAEATEEPSTEQPEKKLRFVSGTLRR